MDDPAERRRLRFRLAGLCAVAALIMVGAYALRTVLDERDDPRTQAAASVGSADDDAGEASSTTTTEAPTTTSTAPPIPSDQTKMVRRQRITGGITPKSVVASKQGVVIAQNMMYSHTVTAYNAADGALLATIPDSVDLTAYGFAGHPGLSKGAPVEAAFTADGKHAYVSNYSMYGAGFGPEGDDGCTPRSGYDDSFVYRIDTTTFAIDQVIAVGSVPKYVAVTPDQTKVLVTNWCTYDMSIIDAASAKEVARVPIGAYPRGIVVSPDSTTAYVAVMGSTAVLRVDLASQAVSTLANPGSGPRHLDISPDGSTVYVTNNGSGTVSRVDVASGHVTNTVKTGSQPRSMALSADGTALYVVNYGSSTITKLRASDLSKLDEIPTDPNPIGITYEPTTRSVWVACYGGSIIVLDDAGTPPPASATPVAAGTG